MKALVNQLSGNSAIVNKSSYYFNTSSATVRVSNHLPKRSNWEENQNFSDKIFIFINENNDLNESKIEKYLESEFHNDYNYFFLFDTEEAAIESINYIKSQI
jgi:hypothetical protein